MKIEEVMILAGGLGTRLKSVVPDLPKVLAPVLGEPFLFHIIEHWQKQGVKRFILCTGYKANVIEEVIKKSKFKNIVFFSKENKKLGTGGAILNALKLVKSNYFIVQNGDTFIPLKISDIVFFKEKIIEKTMFMILLKNSNETRYGLFSIDKESEVVFKKKYVNINIYINGGIYLFNSKKISNVSYNFKKELSFETDILPDLINRKEVVGNVFSKPFIDIGIPSDYDRSAIFMKKNINLF